MAAKKKVAEVTAAPSALLEALRKKFGADSATIPGIEDARSQIRGYLRCGIDVVDNWVMGGNGAPLGRATEIFSEESGGKTSFVWQSIGEAQAAEALVIDRDSEGSYDAARAEKFGVRNDKLVLLQPWTFEEALEQMHFALSTTEHKGPILMAWDSVASEQFDGEVKGNFTKDAQDPRAKRLGQFCRSVLKLALEKQAHVLFVNQIRDKRGVMFGNKVTTPGGHAIKFAASLRLQLFPGKTLKDALKLHIGRNVTFFAAKSRFSPPFRKAKARLIYDKGWDNLWSTVNHAKDLAVIPKASKPTPETYLKAVEALGWKTFQPVETLFTGPEPENPDEADDEEVDDFMGVASETEP